MDGLPAVPTLEGRGGGRNKKGLGYTARSRRYDDDDVEYDYNEDIPRVDREADRGVLGYSARSRGYNIDKNFDDIVRYAFDDRENDEVSV